MNFMRHSELLDKHAFLGASNYHWLNYSDEKLADTYLRKMASLRGTELHAFAAQCIKLGQNLPNKRLTLNMYVNDAIGFQMRPEQILYYSPYCFGTADAISFKHNLLRIHDLKTGKGPTHMEQLEVYTSLFCLEYDVDIKDIDVELRIYQNDEVRIHNPDITEIIPIMDKIVTYTKLIESWENSGYES